MGGTVLDRDVEPEEPVEGAGPVPVVPPEGVLLVGVDALARGAGAEDRLVGVGLVPNAPPADVLSEGAEARLVKEGGVHWLVGALPLTARDAPPLWLPPRRPEPVREPAATPTDEAPPDRPVSAV